MKIQGQNKNKKYQKILATHQEVIQHHNMISQKWKSFCKNIFGKGFLEEHKSEHFNHNCLRKINLLSNVFFLSFQIMILIMVEYSVKIQNIRTIICTIFSVILNLTSCFLVCKKVQKFKEFFFASLIILWVGLYHSPIDKISNQILQKSIIIMEIQIYNFFYLVYTKNVLRIVVLFFGYTRIIIGFNVQNINKEKESILGLLFFILPFMFFLVLFWISNQSNNMYRYKKKKDHLRYIELENILNNDIQQGIMIITPKTKETIYSVNDLKVKYVNNYFLNQFNVTRQEALHILPHIHSSTIKIIKDRDNNLKFQKKDSIQIKQQTFDFELQKNENENGQIDNQMKKSILLQAKESQTARNQIKSALKLSKTPRTLDYELNNQIDHDVVINVAESTQIIQEKGIDTVHNLPPSIKNNKKQLNKSNITNNVQSFILTTHPENLLKEMASQYQSQDQNKIEQRMFENKITFIHQKQREQNSKQQSQNDQSLNSSNIKKRTNSLQNIENLNEVIVNSNKQQNRQNIIYREGSNKNVHSQHSKTKIETLSKNKISQNGEGFMNLLDRINQFHNKYFLRKDKSLSLSEKVVSDEKKSNQSLIIWEYKYHKKITSQNQVVKNNDQIHEINTDKNDVLNYKTKKSQFYSNLSVNLKFQKNTEIDSSNNQKQIQEQNSKRQQRNEQTNEKSLNKQVQFNSNIINQNQMRESNYLSILSEKLHSIQKKDMNAQEKQYFQGEKKQNIQQSKLKSIDKLDKLDDFNQTDNIMPSVFQKMTFERQQSNQDNIDMNLLSNSVRPTNDLILNSIQHVVDRINCVEKNGNKKIKKASSFGNNLIAKKIDENILEITRGAKTNENDYCFGELGQKLIQSIDGEQDQENETQYLEIKLFKCEMDKEDSIMIVVNNINQRIQYERLKEIQTKNDQMLANVTHDLKTPLNCMSLMIEGMKLDKQYNEQTINMILENANLLMCLIQDILDYSQIKKGKLRLVQSCFQVSEIIQEVINLFQMQADQKNIKLVSNICYTSNSSFNESTNIQIQTNNIFNNSHTHLLSVGNQQHYQTNQNSFITFNEMQNNRIETMKDIQMHQDKNRIKQILINLISNALKFTQEGQIEIRCDLKEIENENENASIKIVEFSVKDTGVGMNLNIKSQLFKMFNTFDQKGLNKNGIGLGLTICKRLVQFLGPSDNIEVESEVSKGSKFSFQVFQDLRDFDDMNHTSSEETEETPQQNNNKSIFHDLAKSIKHNYNFKDEDQIDESQLVVNSLPMTVARLNILQLYNKDLIKDNKGKIICKQNTPDFVSTFNMLIVDDQPFNIVAFKIILKSFKQIQITEAFNGVEAFEKYQKQKYDFILMDYNMPIMNGYDSIKLIRLYEEQNNLPPSKIIIVSGFDEKQKQLIKAMQGGADDYLTKPVNFQILAEKLNEYMNERNKIKSSQKSN